MKGDFSRQTFDSTRHFTTVRMQQGRVQLDADWNEQADLALYRVETEAADVIGGCGGPLDAAAFGIVLDLDDLDAAEKARLQALDPPYAIVAGDFVLTPGRYYVDGILCESEHAVPYTLQPDLPGLDPIDVSQAGFTIVYLDVWQRHLTWLDDPLLRETALGGPDTATRTRTVWQVRTVFVGPGPVTCVDDPQAYLDAIAAGTGVLSARAKREETVADPCIVPASAGYRGLENQLYRVEIHDPGEAYDLTAGPGDRAITVSAPDRVVYTGGSWSVGDTVEIFRSAAGSDPMEGWLATVVANDTATDTLTLSTSLPDLGAADVPRIRPVEATFKWSRDNGSIVTLVSSVTDRDLVVTSLGPDESWFLPGHWVELVDEVAELGGRPGFLAEIEDVDKASRTVTLRVEPPAFTGALVKLRRWDGIGAVKTNPPGTTEPFVELEDGVQVSFSDGTYETGDYWLIPARTATADERSGTIEWPAEDDEPVALPPLGIRHHYCKLAVLESDGSAFSVADDCRSLFPPLTQLATLVYVGGDGQEARPGEPLPQLLEAGVFRGRHPVEGATVRFTADAGGRLAADLASVGGGTATIERTTDADGIAACVWLPANDLARPSQQVEARLLDAGGDPLAPQLDYNGQLSIASEVAYVPGACDDLAAATTVQEALDILCNRPTGGSCCVVVEPETSLDELLKELVDEGTRDICLCLKPGEYRLEDLELARDPVVTLAIEGCCPGARVEVGRLELHGLDEVRLRGLELVLRTERPLFFDRCAEVAIQGCRVTRAEAPGPVCEIGRALRVRISDCVLDGSVRVDDAHLDDVRDLIALPVREFALEANELAGTLARDVEGRKALATKISLARRTERLSLGEQEAYRLLSDTLKEEVTAATIVGALGRLRAAAAFAFAGPALVLRDAGAEALVEATDIVGALVVGDTKVGFIPDQEMLKQIRAALAEGLLTLRGAGSLHVRDVRVTHLAVVGEQFEQVESVANGGKALQVLRALHVVDTEVLRNPNLVAAVDATLSGVDFAGPQDDVGALLAVSAIVTACRAPNDFRLFVVAIAFEPAANLRINVVEL